VAIPWPPITPPAPGQALGADLVHLTLALPTVGDVWGGGRWGTATWDDLDYNNFVDASCDCHGVSVQRGRSGPLDHAAPARATFTLDNHAGLYSPWNTVDVNGRDALGPIMGPGVPVRAATATGPIYTGFVTTVTETDDGGESTVNVTAADALSYLGDANGFEQAAQGANELAGARLARIITNAQVPALVDRSLATGVTALQATTLAKGALEEAWLTADSDGGTFWATPAGVLRYVDPPGLEAPEFTEPIATFTDDVYDQPGVTLCPIMFTVTSDRDHVKNVVSVARVGGTTQTVADQASIARYGARSTQRTDLIHTTDDWSLTVARFMLARLANAAVSISPIDGVPTDDDTWYAFAHHVDLGSRVRLRRARFGQTLDVVATVDGITHSITLDQWTVTLRCSPGTQVTGYSHWGAAVWGSSRWLK
jgi:hypothetical protein